jgi:hypothetical protein
MLAPLFFPPYIQVSSKQCVAVNTSSSWIVSVAVKFLDLECSGRNKSKCLSETILLLQDCISVIVRREWDEGFVRYLLFRPNLSMYIYNTVRSESRCALRLR